MGNGTAHRAQHTISIPGKSKQIFEHCEKDDSDILHRLKIFEHPDGNLDVQLRGIALMALVMLNDYYSDQNIDKQIGKYNPIQNGKWEYMKKKNELIAIINNLPPNSEMDAIFSLDEALNRGFWKI